MKLLFLYHFLTSLQHTVSGPEGLVQKTGLRFSPSLRDLAKYHTCIDVFLVHPSFIVMENQTSAVGNVMPTLLPWMMPLLLPFADLQAVALLSVFAIVVNCCHFPPGLCVEQLCLLCCNYSLNLGQ